MEKVACGLLVALLTTACTGPVGSVAGTFTSPDDSKCVGTRAHDPKSVTVDEATLCAAEEDGSLALRTKLEARVHTMDQAGAPARDPGFAGERCRALCGDAAYTYCLFEGEYQAFAAEDGKPGCGWAKAKGNATLTCYQVETYQTTCSPVAG